MGRPRWFWIPLFGIPLFLLLYIWASIYYPGGSQADPNAKGFSWVHNYWCNLLNDRAINGQQNPARPIAAAGMAILCLALSVFWLRFPATSLGKQPLVRWLQVAGVAAMVTALLLNTSLDHDMITNLASLLGLIAVAGTLAGLYKLKWWGLFWLGIVNLVLVLLNNLFYYDTALIAYLPLVQKISFLSFLAWFYFITLQSIRSKYS
jgi:hypothetical protein